MSPKRLVLFTWATGHTETYNEHWVEEGRPTPYEKFPKHEYLRIVFEFLESDERILWFENGRDMMLSWACVAYLTKQAMQTEQRSVLFSPAQALPSKLHGSVPPSFDEQQDGP